MIKTLSGDADRIKTDITAVDGVEEVHIVAGDVDLIAKVTVETTAAVKDVAATKIHEIDGVDSTQTYIAMD
jgi:DNA-binding Lrp family transcriptional regulator